MKRFRTHKETFISSLGMTFNLIPAGRFIMGSPSDEPGHWDEEYRHQVTLTQSYYMQTTEVTQGQWKAVMGSNPSRFSDCGDDCPVERVSWNDVQDFISELNKRGEGSYRLPTEAEWEYAARAGTTTAFANGDITKTVTAMTRIWIQWGGMSTIQATRLILSPRNSPTPGAFMTCTEMFGSGFRTDTAAIHPVR